MSQMVSFRLDDEVFSKLQLAAQAEERSITYMMVKAIRDMLGEVETAPKKLAAPKPVEAKAQVARVPVIKPAPKKPEPLVLNVPAFLGHDADDAPVVDDVVDVGDIADVDMEDAIRLGFVKPRKKSDPEPEVLPLEQRHTGKLLNDILKRPYEPGLTPKK